MVTFRGLRSGRRLVRRGAMVLFAMAGCLVAVALLAGCAVVGKPLPSDPAAVAILQRLARQQTLPARIKAAGRIRFEGPQGRRSLQAVWAVEAPDRLRVELVSFFGQPVARLAADGDTLFLQEDSTRRRLSQSRASAVMERIIGLGIGVEDLVALVTGRLPEVGSRRAVTVQRDAGTGDVVWLDRRRRQVARLHPDTERGLPTRLVVHSSGASAMEIRWERWKSVGPWAVPVAMEIRAGTGRLALQADQVQVPAGFDGGLFQLPDAP